MSFPQILLLCGMLGFCNTHAAQSANFQVKVQSFNATCANSGDAAIRITIQQGMVPVVVQWLNAGNGIAGSAIVPSLNIPFNINQLQAGDYQINIASTNGSDTTLALTLTAPPPLVVGLEVQGEKCFGEQTGAIAVTQLSGGTPPYLTRLNDGAATPTFNWTNLPYGSYFLEVEDANGCTDLSGIVLPSGLEFEFFAGADTITFTGDTITGALQSNQPLQVLNWTPAGTALFQTNGTYQLYPLFDTEYTIVAVDTNGCKAEDKIRVQTRRKRSVYAPNVFWPEAPETENRQFSLFTGGGVRQIEWLQIGDRNGRLWFERRNLLPDDPLNGGWDGTAAGVKAPEGVYFWAAKIILTDGRADILRGDVTLVR